MDKNKTTNDVVTLNVDCIYHLDNENLKEVKTVYTENLVNDMERTIYKNCIVKTAVIGALSCLAFGVSAYYRGMARQKVLDQSRRKRSSKKKAPKK